MLLLGLLLAVGIADWVPARWVSPDPQSLELLDGTPVNCLLAEPAVWSAAWGAHASARGLIALGVVRPGGEPVEAARRAIQAGLSGVVLEGAFEPAVAEAVRKALGAQKHLIELPPRRLMRLDGDIPLVGTCQGLWPGIQVQAGGSAKAQPTGGPWIDTNSGFLRFLKSATEAPIWVAHLPPEKTVLPVERYLNAISDAEMLGARWVLALDDDFHRRLLAREARALADWKRMVAHLRFYEDHREWRALKPYSRLALVEDVSGTGLLSRGLLDMFVGRNIPVRPVPVGRLDKAALRGARLAVAVAPSTLSDAQKEALKDVARAGGTLLNGPPGWEFSPPRGDQITLPNDELERITDVWQGINAVVGRGNFGVRLFNVSGILSSLLGDPEGGQVVLHLVNFTNYPIESVTVHLTDKYRRARLYAPGRAPADLELYPIDGGMGVDLDRVGVCAVLVIS
ncbi:MAG: hypothetical protein FJW34_00750 [Acidobacteria bacterium]|nr:hypothetical protein [Acidobacteriota bacterium]